MIRADGQEGVDPLPRVHGGAALLQRWLLGTHQGAIQASHLDYYLHEFTFRLNRRTSRSRGKLFYRLVQQAVAVDPVPQSQLRGGADPLSPTTQPVNRSQVHGPVAQWPCGARPHGCSGLVGLGVRRSRSRATSPGVKGGLR